MIIVGGYIGTLFIMMITMFVSAKLRTSVVAALIPFVVIFIPSFLENVTAVKKLIGILPNQLLQIKTVLNSFDIYQIGNKVFTSGKIIFAVYTILTILAIPALYRAYSRMQIR